MRRISSFFLLCCALIGCGTTALSAPAVLSIATPPPPTATAPITATALPTTPATQTSTAIPTATTTATPRPTIMPQPTAIPLLPTLDAAPELLDLRLAGVWQARSGQVLRREAIPDLLALLEAARQAGFKLEIRSGYRSYADQRATFEKWVQHELSAAQQWGAPITRATARERAATYSAIPGHSEHQSGLAIDLLPSGAAELGFVVPPDVQVWLAYNAHFYGWVQSYPLKLDADGVVITADLTGYTNEPWHWRWQGRAAAQDLFERGYLDPHTSIVPPPLPLVCDADHDPCALQP